MATEGEERFLRSSHLLLKGTFYISKKVLVREAEIVHQQTGLNLDDLLKEKKVKLKHEFRNKRHREKLFPANGKTNVEDWDISLLTGVLLIVFQTSLPEEDRTAVKNIKYQRNEVYAHCAMASLDEVDYTDTCKYLKDAFNRLASGCGPEVKQECDAIIDTCLNGSLDHKSHVEHLKRLAEKDDLLLEILEKIETIGKNTTNDLKNTFKVENSALKIYITEDNSRRENNICDTIRNSKLTREEMRTVVLEALQQEKDGRQRKTIEVLDSQLDIYGRDEDEDKIALAEYIIVTVTNEALKRGNTSMEYTQIREIIQEILDEIVKQSGVKPLLAIKGSVIIRFESCSYEQLSRLIIYMESTDMTDRLNKLAGKLSRLMSTKEQLQVSFSFSLKTLENLLAEIETNNERECKKSVHIPILIESDEGKNRVLDLFKGGGLTNKLHKLSTALTETVGANINVKPSVSMEAFDDFDHEDIYEEIREPEEKPSDDEEDLYLTTEEPEEQDIQEEPSDKRGIDERLASAQKALLLQEETVCRNEQIVMSDKISCLERTVPAKESDQRQTQERIAKMRQQMERLECENKNLHNDLVKAEERCIRLELANKSAMDDLQRMTLTLKDNDTKHQNLVKSLTKQINNLECKAQNLQKENERLTLRIEKKRNIVQCTYCHAPQFKVQQRQASLNQTTSTMTERHSGLQRTRSEHYPEFMLRGVDSTRHVLHEAEQQSELSEAELARSRLHEQEIQLTSSKPNPRISQFLIQDSGQELSARKDNFETEASSLIDHVKALEHALATLETEKREFERKQILIEKEKSISTPYKIGRGYVMELKSLYESVCKLEKENAYLTTRAHNIQARLRNKENADRTTKTQIKKAWLLLDHRMMTKLKVECLLERVNALNIEIAKLKIQLETIMRICRDNALRSARTADEIEDINSLIDTSPTAVANSRDQNPSSLLIESEKRTVDDPLIRHTVPY